MDLLIALGHIVAGIHPLAGSTGMYEQSACRVLGVLNEFALIASNLWYIFLAVDLLRAIRNPFQYVQYKLNLKTPRPCGHFIFKLFHDSH